MKRIAVIYGSVTGNTSKVAGAIRNEIRRQKKDVQVTLIDISDFPEIQLADYDLLILGSSTWNIGELDEWDDFLDRLGRLDTAETRFALFGLGDQREYPDRFVDTMGSLYDRLRNRGAVVVGDISAEEYSYSRSKAVEDGNFVGLALDDDTEADLTGKRVKQWVNDLQKVWHN